ncbi:MAG: hypothetical protein KJP03_00010 [Gammaproteobacteria bacterium]|nr:hypothetical protein [Gammaproteobacteria bacterium]
MTITRMMLFLALLSLTACASGPRYVAAHHAGDFGYYSEPINPDRYRVAYNGDHRLDLEDVRTYTLLHAAELTLREGYDWFQIVERESRSIHHPRTTTRYAAERNYTRTRHCGLLGCQETVRPSGYPQFSTSDTPATVKHRYSIEIAMGEGELPAEGDAHDARDIVHRHDRD